MKKRVILSVVIALSVVSGVSAQSYRIGRNHTISSMLMRDLDSLSANYFPSAGFSSAANMREDFKTVPHLSKLHGSMEYTVSDDGQFLVCVWTDFCGTDSVKTKEQFKNNLLGNVLVSLYPEVTYMNFMEMRNKHQKKLEKQITYASPEYAKETFNADTVACFELKMHGRKLHDKYTGNTVLMIQKSGRGVITFFCFYTKEGEKRLDTYMKAVENMLWFRECIHTEEFEPVIVIPFSKVNPPKIIN